ncbi:MAG: glycosyltransferase family A protein, partial [Actinomycetota bacterium]|nr:glycosyltransferase family A protein [Actinomycetota bacterium]
PGTPVGALVRWLREMARGDAHVDRFVRAYVPAPGVDAPGVDAPGVDAVGVDAVGAGPSTPGSAAPLFLSVLLRTQGRRAATLQESLLCLAAQTCDDFEVLTLLHDGDERSADSVRELVEEFHESFSRRVRVVSVSGGGRCRPLNEGALLARGEYLAMLDDDDLVLADWVETFRDAARRAPGRVVRTAVANQRIEARPGRWDGEDGYEVVDRPRLVFSLDFDHVDHLLDNRTPNNGYAFPRSLVTELGLRWDESLPVLEDWDHLLWSASICGVRGVPRITALLRSWEVGEDSKSQHSPALWEATRRRVIDKHGATPLLLDRGAFPQLRARLIDGDVAAEHAARLEQDVHRTAVELDAARARLEVAEQALEATRDALRSTTRQLEEVHGSTSWRITAGLRLAARAARRVRTPPRS